MRGEGKLIVTSNVQAEVWAGGRKLGTTPLRYNLVEGSYEVELRFAGATQIKRVRIGYGRESRINTRFEVAMITIVAVPAGVVCELDGRVLGRWELEGLEVVAGQRTLTCDDPSSGNKRSHVVDVRPRARLEIDYATVFGP